MYSRYFEINILDITSWTYISIILVVCIYDITEVFSIKYIYVEYPHLFVKLMNNFPEELNRGNGLRLIIDRTRLLLALRKPPTQEEIKNLLQGTGFEFERVPGNL